MGVRERYESKNKKSKSTGVKARYDKRIQKSQLETTIGFDTFESDLNSLGKTVKSVYEGWQTEETLNNTRSSIEAMQDRISAYQEYQALNGGKDKLGAIAKSYDNILGEWDKLSSDYGKYKNADEYNTAKKLYEEKSTTNLDDVKKEVEKLQKDYDNAKKDYDGVKIPKVGTLNEEATKRTGVPVYYNSSKDEEAAKKARDNLIKGKYGYTLEELENALSNKKYYLEDATKIQDDIKLNAKETEMGKSKEGKQGYELFLADETTLRQKEIAEQEARDNMTLWERYKSDAGEYYDTTLPGGELTAVIQLKRKYKDENAKPTKEWTQEQRYTFGAYYMEDPEKAYDYGARVNNAIGKEKQDEKAQEIKDSATSSFWSGAGHTLGAILTAPTGLLDMTEDMTDVAAGRRIVEDGRVTPFERSQMVTSGITEHLNDVSGTLDEDIPVIGGKGLGDLYGLGTSVAQSAVSAYTLGGVGTLVSYFGQGAAAGVDDALSRGATDEQALLYGAILGAAEGVSEKIGIDNLFKIGSSRTLKEFFMNVLKQGGAEGFEEGFSSIVGNIADNFVMQDKSNFNALVKEYMASGLSANEAKEKAWKSTIGDIAYDVLGGFVSGAAHAVPHTGIATLKANRVDNAKGQSIRANERVGDMLEIARLSPQETDTYNLYTSYAKKGITAENISDKQVGRLYASSYEGAMNTIDSEKASKEEKQSAIKTLSDLSRLDTDNVVKKNLNKLNVGEETKVASIEGDVEIQGIKIGEKPTLLTSAGEVSIDDVTLSERDAELVATAQTMDEKMANVFIQQDDGITNVKEYANSFNLVSAYTEHNFDQNTIIENKGVLSTDQVKAVYNATVKARYDAQQKKLDDLSTKQGRTMFVQGALDDSIIDYKSKTTDGSKVNWDTLSSKQRSAIKFVSLFTKATGVNVTLIKSEIKNGKHDGKNGSYNPETNTIEIDVYAGRIEANTIKDTILPTLSHEMTHWMKAKAISAYEGIRNDILKTLSDKSGISSEKLIDAEMTRLKNAHPEMNVTPEKAIDEIVARACEDMLSNSNEARKLLNRMSATEQQSFIEKMKETIDNLMQWVNDLLTQYKNADASSGEAALLREYKKELQRISKQWDAMLKEAINTNQALQREGITGEKLANKVKAQKNTTNEGDEQFSIREEFYAEFDKWVADGRKNTNINFVVGKTSDALKTIGMKDQEIILKSGTVNQKLKAHKEMTTDIFKKIPELLEYPIIVQFSDAIDPKTKKPKYDSRISVLGELYADVIENGNTTKKPVLVALELSPTNQKKTAVLDFSLIKSAYAKNALQQYLNENSILYIEPNKKRTDNWLSLNRLQLPLGETKYGSIRKITYSGNKVKIQNSTKKTPMEIALEKAGLVDEFGNVQNSDRDLNDIISLQNRHQELQDEYNSLDKEVKELQNSAKYKNFVDSLSTLQPGEELDNAIKEYGKWTQESGLYAKSKRMSEITGEQKDIRASLEDERKMSRDTFMKSIQNLNETEKMEFVNRAIERYGTTNKINLASYLMLNGKMLDFSDGQGYRVQDHREISEILDMPESAEYSDGLIAFMNMGNIRLQTYGIDISRVPNKAQKSALRDVITQVMRDNSEFTVDFSKANGYTDGSVDYPRGTSTSKILEDIDSYFKTGVVPEYKSTFGEFLYSDRDSLGNTLSEGQQSYFANSKMRDDDGNLVVMYQGSPTEFFEFDRKKSSPFNLYGRGFYFTDSKSHADQYGNLTRAYYLNIKNPISTYKDDNIITKKQLRKYLEVVAENEDYSIENYGAYDIETILNSVYSKDKSDYAMLQDISATAIGDLVEAIELFNKVNGTKFDGLILNTETIIFDSKQAKLTTNKNPTESKDIRFSDRDTYAPTFYSQMGKTIDDMKQDKIGASSVVSYLKGRGVKNEEIKWSGIETFLEGKKSVTKAELQEFIAGSVLQIEENTYDGFEIEVTSEDGDNYIVRNKKTKEILDEWEWQEDVEDGMEGYVSKHGEIALSVDEIEENAKADWNSTRWSDYKIRGGANYRELTFKLPNTYYSNHAMRTHWGENAYGILAHARIQDFETDNGKMLFIEEIQSDWHNEGHKRGYAKKLSQKESKKVADLIKKQETLAEQSKEKYLSGDIDSAMELFEKERELFLERKEIEGTKDGVSDAPFKDNYHEYVLKSLIRKAAEQGYDSIGWTPANLQSQRWSDEFAEGYRIEYDQNIPKFLNKYGKKWGAKVDTTTLDSGAEVWSMDITDSMKNSVLYEGQVIYSDRDNVSIYDKMGETNRLINENAKLKADIERLKERLKIERQVTHGNYFNENQVDTVAGHIRNIANSDYSKADLVKEIKDVYSYIAHTSELNWDDVFAKCYEVAQNVLGDARPTTETNDYYKHILKEIRGTRISVNEGQTGNAKSRFGDKYRNAFWGKVTIANDGIALDSKWKEWSRQYPNLFDANISDADQLVELYDIYDSLKESAETVVEYDKEEQTRWLAREIYNQYWNVSPIRTTADKYDKQIKRLNYEHRKAMQEFRDDYNERLKEQHKVDKEKAVALANKIRERKDKEIAEIKKLGKERMDAYKENAQRKTKIQAITANALTLNRWLTKNSKDEHIHEAMKGPVISLLNAIDFSSRQLLGMKGSSNKGTPTQKDISLSKALNKVKDMMNDASNAKEGLIELYGHDMDEEIVRLAESVDDIMRTVGDNEFVLNKMTLAELETLDKIVKTIKHAVTQINTFHTVQHKQGIANLSESGIEHLDSLGKTIKHSGLRGKLDHMLKWNNTIPYYAFKRLGEAGKKVFEAMQDGWDKLAYNAKEITDFTNSTYTSKEVREWEKQTKTFTIDQPDGSKRTFDMSIAQIMALHCVAKQDDAKRHLLTSGMTIAEFDNKGKVTSEEENILLGITDIATITGKLNKRQLEVADKLQEFMNTVCAKWGNEVSLQRFAIEMFNAPNYFPIKVSPATITKEEPKDVNDVSLFRLLNMSFTKSRNEFANQSIEIGNIFDIFAQHTSDMAKYNALALPVLDAYRWYSYKGRTDLGKEYSTYASMQKALGKDSVRYFNTFMKDINGASNVARDNFGSNFFRNAKIASVANNLRVVLLQPTAYLKASAVIDNRYLTQAFLHKPKIAKAEKYCGMALWKSMGYYDVNITKGLTEKIKHDETWKDKAIEWSMKGAEVADKVTFGYLWNACELEIRKTRKDLKVGSEEFYNTIGKRLREVIYATQVVDSTMTRSQIMRSPDNWDKMLTAFMSEPTLAYNMLLDCVITTSLDKRKNGKGAFKRNFKKNSRVFTAYVVTNIVAAAVESCFDVFRNDDDEEDDLVEFAQHYLTNVMSDLSIIGKIPYLKEIPSLIQGYSPSRMDTQWMESFAYAGAAWWKVLSGDGEGKGIKAVEHSLKAFSSVSGLAFFNVYRDFMATLNSLDILTEEELKEMFDELFGY